MLSLLFLFKSDVLTLYKIIIGRYRWGKTNTYGLVIYRIHYNSVEKDVTIHLKVLKLNFKFSE